MTSRMSISELDAHMRSRGVPMDQRKRILSAAKLGVPNPLAQLGLKPVPQPRSPASSRSRSPARSRGVEKSGEGRASGKRRGSSRRQDHVRNAIRALHSTGAEDDEQDVNSFLAGARKSTLDLERRKVQELSRQQQEASAKASRERELSSAFERPREEERRRQERRQPRREEQLRTKEETRRRRREGSEGSEDEDRGEASEERPDTRDSSRKAYFSQAYKGNEKVSKKYEGLSDAELERPFSAASGAGYGEKLMTEEEVLAILRGGWPKPK
eukprot:TRINITY_DN14385_c5_g1_i1.p1 TRINITY_DN14385_c5_g1~~TRINITY_DN14385_c5_g1_i1.p1  ORF type:complete len:300 (-),score=45.94 TRINITY_DN14385_c5_g1_i1:82-894(-)